MFWVWWRERIYFRPGPYTRGVVSDGSLGPEELASLDSCLPLIIFVYKIIIGKSWFFHYFLATPRPQASSTSVIRGVPISGGSFDCACAIAACGESVPGILLIDTTADVGLVSIPAYVHCTYGAVVILGRVFTINAHIASVLVLTAFDGAAAPTTE